MLSQTALRSRLLKGATTQKNKTGPVLYWMSRDQRVNDNWALLHAQQLALKQIESSTTHSSQPPLYVVFCLAPSFLGATIRQYGFMLKGLEVVEKNLNALNIPFVLLSGDVVVELPKYAKEVGCSTIVTDFNPLRIKNMWLDGIKPQIECELVEVDAHNVVPCWVASQKLEFAAKTIRPKLHEKLKTFLTDIPPPQRMPESISPNSTNEPINWAQIRKEVESLVDTKVEEVEWCIPGEDAAMEALKSFLSSNKFTNYATQRNDPNADGQSNLSPYFHFGHLSPQRAAFESTKISKKGGDGGDSFREELIIRRELADNLCYYNPKYDSFDGLQDWAKKTLLEHAEDKREYLYTLNELESASTHDHLWNAAQVEMMKRGKMHGFMRMYWAKKILEWTRTPQEALQFAIFLNDKYLLDGRDPNGYAGVTWSIGGTHDWGWKERNVFGKIRFMNFAGCKRKFDIGKYCASWLGNSPGGDFVSGGNTTSKPSNISGKKRSRTLFESFKNEKKVKS